MGSGEDRCGQVECYIMRKHHDTAPLSHAFVEPIPAPTFDQLVDAVGDLPSGQLATSGLIPAPQGGSEAAVREIAERWFKKTADAQCCEYDEVIVGEDMKAAVREAYRAGFEAARLAGHCSHRPAPTEPCHACRLTARAQSKEE